MGLLYLFDYRLDGRDGLDLLREAIAAGCQAPIILLTGFGDILTASGGNPPGVDRVLSKPIALAAFRRAVADCVGEKAR